MAYSELIKNFDNIRSYMSDFFIYGFKTREEFDRKSARSYDNERRRIQSYLGDLVSFNQSASGKNLFISLDGKNVTHNPLYKAFKSKSFTNKDITLHFIMLDILTDVDDISLKEMLDIIDSEYLSYFSEPMSFDESTLRKKLKEYEELGIVCSIKAGKTVRYSLVEDKFDVSDYRDAIRFFTEENILGVVGSYLEDKEYNPDECFSFKNHYIMNAYDAEILEKVLQGIHEHRRLEVANFSRRSGDSKHWKVIPLKLYVSTQGGRNYLLCRGYHGQYLSFRIDYMQQVELLDVIDDYDREQELFEKVAAHTWGVVCDNNGQLEHVEMDIHVGANENHIVRRLRRECRCGYVKKVDDETYRFVADVYDAYEMVPWIRSYIGRIVCLKCSNERVTNQIKVDIVKMAKQYGVCE